MEFFYVLPAADIFLSFFNGLELELLPLIITLQPCLRSLAKTMF